MSHVRGEPHDVLSVAASRRGWWPRRIDAQGPPSTGDAEPDSGVGHRRTPRRSSGAAHLGSSSLRRRDAPPRVHDLGEWRAEDPGPSSARSARSTRRGVGPVDRGAPPGSSPTTLATARSGSVASRPVPGTSSLSTASTSVNLKGVGKVWQLTAVDTTTRWAICEVFLGPSNTEIAKRFLDRVIRKLRRLGVHVTGVLTDNGPEFSAPFDAHLETLEITHHRTPPRSPNHNACANGSKAPRCRNAGVPRSTGDASIASGNSAPRSTPGSSTTTPAGPTTATTCAAAHPARSSTPNPRSEHHEPQPQGPSVTSTCEPEGLAP